MKNTKDTGVDETHTCIKRSEIRTYRHERRMQSRRVRVGWLVAIVCRDSRITRGLYMTWLGGGFWELQSLKAVWKELTMTHRWTTERYDHIGTSRRVNDHMRCLLSLPVMRVTLEESVQRGGYWGFVRASSRWCLAVFPRWGGWSEGWSLQMRDPFALPPACASPSFADEVGCSGGWSARNQLRFLLSGDFLPLRPRCFLLTRWGGLSWGWPLQRAGH